jgi:hypothetical protein
LFDLDRAVRKFQLEIQRSRHHSARQFRPGDCAFLRDDYLPVSVWRSADVKDALELHFSFKNQGPTLRIRDTFCHSARPRLVRNERSCSAGSWRGAGCRILTVGLMR